MSHRQWPNWPIDLGSGIFHGCLFRVEARPGRELMGTATSNETDSLGSWDSGYRADSDKFLCRSERARIASSRMSAASPTRSPVPTYLWGSGGSGKTHLLKSVREALREQGATAGWMDASVQAPPDFNDAWAAVLMDDVHLYTAVQQQAAFNWFVNALASRSGQPRWVLAAGDRAPAELELREDLRTRLGWGHLFGLQVLSEPERRGVCGSMLTRGESSCAMRWWTSS